MGDTRESALTQGVKRGGFPEGDTEHAYSMDHKCLLVPRDGTGGRG